MPTGNPFTSAQAPQMLTGSPYTEEQANILRQQQLADLLRKQSLEPLGDTQTIGGWAIQRSPMEGVAKLAQALGAKYAYKDAEEQSRTLGERYKSDLANTLSSAQQALQGSPEVKGQDIYTDDYTAVPKSDQEGYGAKAAVPGSTMGYYETLLKHPATQGMGMQGMQSEMQMQRLAQILKDARRGGDGSVAGVNPIAMQLAMTPGGEKLGTMVQDANKPVALREGDLVRPGKNGAFESVYTQPKLEPGMQPVRDATGKVIGSQAIPGYASGSSDIVGAKEGAKAGFDMITVDTPSGPKMMTKAQVAQQAGGGRPPDFPRVTPQEQLVRDAERKAIVAKELADPASRADPAAWEGLQKEAKSLGIPLQGGAAKASETQRGKFFGDNYADLQKGAMDANAKIAKLDRMSSLLDGVNTGKLTPAGTELAAYAQSIGFDIDKNLGNKQAAQALANEIALQLRNPSGGAGMPGALSDKDREFLRSMTPDISKTPEGNKLLIESARKLAKRDQEIAKLAREYNDGNLDNGFYQKVQEYADKNPLFSPASKSGASSDAKTFASLPDPAQFNGKRMKAPDRTILRSNGKAWVKDQ